MAFQLGVMLAFYGGTNAMQVSRAQTAALGLTLAGGGASAVLQTGAADRQSCMVALSVRSTSDTSVVEHLRSRRIVSEKR